MLIDLHALPLYHICNEGQVAHDTVASNLWWDLKPRSCSENARQWKEDRTSDVCPELMGCCCVVRMIHMLVQMN